MTIDTKQCEENLRHCEKVRTDLAQASEFLRVATNVGVQGIDEPVRKIGYALSTMSIIATTFKAGITAGDEGVDREDGNYWVRFSPEEMKALHWHLNETKIEHLQDETSGQAARKSHLLALRARTGDILNPVDDPDPPAIAEKPETPMVNISIAIDPEHPIATALFARAVNDLREFAHELDLHRENVVAGKVANCAWMPNGRLEANYDLRDPRDGCWDNDD